MGPFRLERFLPRFDPEGECHIGERIVRDDGSLEYLKTFRLSTAQIRRGFLLTQLSEAGWNLTEAAVTLRCTPAELVKRIQNAALGYMLKPEVIAAAMKS